MKALTIFTILICLLQTVFAQTGLQIQEGPIYQMDCSSTCVMLHANYPKQLKTNQYSFTSIPYQPISTSGTTINLLDDHFSTSIPLGFSFCFFEQVYTNCFISDNGVITFNSLYSNASCYNNTQQLLPYFNSTCPDKAIFGLFMDLAPSLGGDIKYLTTGLAPFRKFVVTYSGLKLFGATCTTASSTFQIVLNETTNNIDVFIGNKAVCNSLLSDSKNYSTVGVQNSGATQAFTAPGKHASIFTTTNEGIRIAPSGPSNYTLVWTNATNQTIASNVDSFQFCPPFYPYSKVKVTATYSCPSLTLSDTVKLLKNAPSILNCSVVNPSCSNTLNGSILINGSGVAPFTYKFANSPFSNNNLFANLGAGTFLIAIKDANGCTKDTLITLLPITSINVIIDTIIKPTCPNNNGSITIHAVGGTPPYSYVWPNGSTGTTLNNVGVGTYNVLVTDANGCTKLEPIMVTAIGLPILTAVKFNPICGNNNGSISVSVTGATPPYNYQWTAPLANTPTVSNLSAGLYSLTVSDLFGCQESKIYQLVDTLNVLNIKTVTQTTCGLSNGKIAIIAYGGLAPYTYAWSPSGQTTATANNLSVGTHTVVITAANGCTKIDSTTILPSLSMVNQFTMANANCDLDNGLISLNGVLNFNSNYTVLWSNGSTQNSIANLAAGNYTLTTTDLLGCLAIDTITILNDGHPKLNVLSYQEPTCYGDSNGMVSLSGSGGVGPYKYSLDGINFSSIAQLNNISGGTFTIYITDANSCPNDTVITFSQPTKISLLYNADTIACFGDSTANLSFNASGDAPPFTYSFNQGPFTNQTQFNHLPQGEYTVEVTDSKLCHVKETLIVVGPTAPLKIQATVTDVPCFENNKGSINIELSGGWPPYQYTWSNPLFTSLNISNLDVTHESITVKDEQHCEVSAAINVEQLFCCTAIIPNAFTPNGDQLNDKVTILPISEVSEVDLKIFNRWGQLVFATKDILNGWNGTFNGLPCEIGSYFYLFTFKCPFSETRVIQKGDINLIR